MKGGAETDISSGRPVTESLAEAKLAKDNAEKVSLKEKAEFLDIIQGDAGSQVINTIEGLLIKRIEKLVSNDSEATAYHKMLKAIGYKVNTAKRAVEALYLKQLKDEGD